MKTFDESVRKMKYRSRMDIVSSMLETAMHGSSKTRIMYSAYLSYGQLKEYLLFLEQKGLLFHDEEAALYKLTEKGMHFLNVYREVKDLMPENKLREQSQVIQPGKSQEIVSSL